MDSVWNDRQRIMQELVVARQEEAEFRVQTSQTIEDIREAAKSEVGGFVVCVCVWFLLRCVLAVSSYCDSDDSALKYVCYVLTVFRMTFRQKFCFGSCRFWKS